MFSRLVSCGKRIIISFMPAAIFVSLLLSAFVNALAGEQLFRAGASVVDISPTNYPVLVNAMFTERTATQTVDRLGARARAGKDSSTRSALAVIDACRVPADLIAPAKAPASQATGI